MARPRRWGILLAATVFGLLALVISRRRHHAAGAPRTAGWVLHGARWYDLFGTIISFGRNRAVQKTLLELAAPVSGENVLDVGCGTGTLALALASRVGRGRVHGIDASPEMIAVAREKAEKAGSQIDFQVGLIETIPFPEATFDLVTSTLMLHHLPDDLKAKGFLEIRRVLKPGGRFLVMDFSAHGHAPCSRLLSIFGHAHGEIAGAEKLIPMLAEAGFTDVESLPTRFEDYAFLRARRAMPA